LNPVSWGFRKNRNFAQVNLPVFIVKKVDQTSINYATLVVLQHSKLIIQDEIF
tara:strand:- start:141 stop:299 length:159 start_codon:yes stop_codon:yes gene_type:complete